MSEKQRSEIIRNLRNYAVNFDDDTIEQYILIIETYNNYELQKIFLQKNDITIFLEDFLARCFEIDIYMSTLSVDDILDIEKILQGEDGSEMFKNLFGYYSWFSQMAKYFASLGISSVSKNFYDATNKTMYLSKVMRTRLFDLNVRDDAYREIVANFIEVFTSQLEDLLDEFLSACYMSLSDRNILALETDFIKFNEDRLEILTTNNRMYDKIINRILRRLDIISEHIDERTFRKLLKSIFDFKLAQEELISNQECLRKVLEI